jgi:hypothetical protein
MGSAKSHSDALGEAGAENSAWPGRGMARAVLLGLGTVQLVNGLWALLAPGSFYRECRGSP